MLFLWQNWETHRNSGIWAGIPVHKCQALFNSIKSRWWSSLQRQCKAKHYFLGFTQNAKYSNIFRFIRKKFKLGTLTLLFFFFFYCLNVFQCICVYKIIFSLLLSLYCYDFKNKFWQTQTIYLREILVHFSCTLNGLVMDSIGPYHSQGLIAQFYPNFLLDVQAACNVIFHKHSSACLHRRSVLYADYFDNPLIICYFAD